MASKSARKSGTRNAVPYFRSGCVAGSIAVPPYCTCLVVCPARPARSRSNGPLCPQAPRGPSGQPRSSPRPYSPFSGGRLPAFPAALRRAGSACQSSQHAFQISYRVLRSGQRIFAIDLILQIDVSPVAGLPELFEDRDYRHHSFTHLALAVFLSPVLEVLHVKIEQPRTRVDDLLNHVGAGAHRMADVD